MPYLTSTDQAEIEAVIQHEAALFDAVLGGEDGVRAHLADDGVLDPSAEQIEDVIDAADEALDAAAETVRVFGEHPRRDLASVEAAIVKLRGALAVAA